MTQSFKYIYGRNKTYIYYKTLKVQKYRYTCILVFSRKDSFVKQYIDSRTYCSSDRILLYTLYLVNCATGITFILPAAMLPLLIEHTHIPLDIAGWIFASFSVGTLLSAIIQGAFSK